MIELQLHFCWSQYCVLLLRRTLLTNKVAGRAQKKVVHTSTECENEALADDNTIEEIVLGIRTNCLMQIIKRGCRHERGELRTNNFRQRDAIRSDADPSH